MSAESKSEMRRQAVLKKAKRPPGWGRHRNEVQCPHCETKFVPTHPHGSLLRYTGAERCRCELCRGAMAEYVAARRKRLKEKK